MSKVLPGKNGVTHRIVDRLDGKGVRVFQVGELLRLAQMELLALVGIARRQQLIENMKVAFAFRGLHHSYLLE